MPSRKEIVDNLSASLQAAKLVSKPVSKELLGELNAGLCNFLQLVPHSSWKKSELKLIKAVTLFDKHFREEEFLSNLNEGELANLITQPFADDGIRMYMMIKTHLIDDKSRRLEIILRFFESDPRETIREEALQHLAKLKWPNALKHAKELWRTGDTVKRMVALRVLESLRAKELELYLELAAKSSDALLISYAMAMRQIASTSKS